MVITKIITCIDSSSTQNIVVRHIIKLEEKLKCYKVKHSLGQKCVLSYVLWISSVINSFVKRAPGYDQWHEICSWKAWDSCNRQVMYISLYISPTKRYKINRWFPKGIISYYLSLTTKNIYSEIQKNIILLCRFREREGPEVLSCVDD